MDSADALDAVRMKCPWAKTGLVMNTDAGWAKPWSEDEVRQATCTAQERSNFRRGIACLAMDVEIKTSLRKDCQSLVKREHLVCRND